MEKSVSTLGVWRKDIWVKETLELSDGSDMVEQEVRGVAEDL